MCATSFTTSIFRRQLRTNDVEAGRVHKEGAISVSSAHTIPTSRLRYSATRPSYSTTIFRRQLWTNDVKAGRVHKQKRDQYELAASKACQQLVKHVRS